ncbi:hypothetical protein CR513_55088, partial [Mucuna pruriens]
MCTVLEANGNPGQILLPDPKGTMKPRSSTSSLDLCGTNIGTGGCNLKVSFTTACSNSAIAHSIELDVVSIPATNKS